MAKIEIVVIVNTETGQVEVKGPLNQKPFVCKTLATAIAAVIDHVPPVTIKPSIINGNGNGRGLIKPN